ncbi:prefoldin subunit beta [Candidatus Woesearchaeota archaeon]|nr:prefoldin subunit beta [Candidatus Woesearchaeota archaeon]
MTEEKINQLQMYEQSLQSLLMQKQQFQAQITEIESALGVMEPAKKVYKIVGNIMVDSTKEELKDDLNTKKLKAEMRVRALEKQESSIKEKVKTLQKEVIDGMKD